MNGKNRLLALFLALAMSLSLLSTSAWAVEAPNEDEVSASTDTGDLEVSGTTSVGSLIADTITEVNGDGEDETETGNGCGITDLEVEESTATVEFQTTEDSELVVAVYTEDGVQMLASGSVSVTSENSTASVTLEGDMPDYFLVQAYLLSADGYEPLCEEYTCELYTEEMQTLMNQTVSDFDSDLVLNLDDDDETNFAVYSESTILVEETDGVNVLTDNGDGTYTITNANSTFTGMSVGDVFAYTYSDGTILTVKVAAIKVSGTTVTITADEDIELTDVFDYLKIESTESDITVDNSELEDGVVYLGTDDGNASTDSLDYSGSESETVSYELTGEFESSYDGTKITSDYDLIASLTVEGKVDLYVSWGYVYLETTVTATAALKGEINAAYTAQRDLGNISIMVFEGVTISFTPTVTFSAEGSVELDIQYMSCIGFGWSSSNGFTNKSYAPKPTSCSLEVEATVYVGMILTPKVTLGLEFCGISLSGANISLSAEIGVKLKASMGWSATDTSYQHDCNVCVAGEVYITGKVTSTVEILKWSKTGTILPQKTYKWKDFYYSFTYGDFGWTTCPHLSYLVTVTATDAYGNVLAGATIGGTGLDEDPVTDSSGVATFYLANGTYTLSVTSDTLYGTKSVTISSAAKTVTIATDPASVGGGTSGDITWNLDEEGTLTISGEGAMSNYSSNNMPWYDYRSAIYKVVVESGVTSIGTYAFYGCSNVASVSLPEGITSIGNYAFDGCTALTTLTLPESVTSLGCYMIRGTKITSITIPKNVTSCSASYSSGYNGPLAGATLLTEVIFEEGITAIPAYVCASYSYSSYIDTVTIPDGVTSIGSYAFYDCDSLTKVNIPKEVSSVSSYAFASCDSLKTVTFNYNDEYVSSSSSGTYLYKLTIGDYVFQGCTSLTSVSLTENLTSIGAYAFDGCTALTTLTLPERVTSLGCYMIRGTKITSITIPKNVTSCGSTSNNGPLSGATELTEVIFEDGITTIPAYVCAANSYTGYITSVTIPDSVTTVGTGAFYSSNSLSEIYFKGSAPTINSNAFYNVTATAYYNGSDSSWTSDVMTDYGGTITWVDSSADDTSEDVTAATPEPEITQEDNSEAIESTESEATEPAESEISETVESFVEVESETETADSANAETTMGSEMPTATAVEATAGVTVTATAMVAYSEQGSAVSTAADDGGTMDLQAAFSGSTSDDDGEKTSTFSGLISGEEYVLLVVKDKEAENLLAADNLLYIAQGTASSSGTLSFTYILREEVTTYVAEVYGAEETTTDISTCTITLSYSSITYSGSAKKPTVKVVDGSTTLTSGSDYTVAYSNNTNAGTATVTITGIGNYSGTVTKTFTIKKASQTISASISAAELASGETAQISATATAGELSYSSSDTGVATVTADGVVTGVAAGTATITVTAAETTNYKSATTTIEVTVTGGTAVEKPDAPTIVSVYSTVQTSAKVTWTKVDGADGYQIYRSTEQDGTYTCIKTISGGSTVKYTNSGLTVGQTYYYKVRAYTKDSSNNWVYSDFSEVRYMPAAVVFDNVYSNSTSRIRILWNEISGAEGYQIWRADSEDGEYKIVKTITSGSTTAYSNTGLESGKTYYYKMRAFTTADGSKVFGAYSDVFAVAVTPEAPTLTVTSSSAGIAKLSWDEISGAAGYQIWRSDSETGTYTLVKSITSGSTTSYSNSGLTSGNTYYYKVRAYTEVDGKKTFGAYSTVQSVDVK